MDTWMIGHKSILLLYVITATYLISLTATSWEILAYLIYLIVNFAIPIFKHNRFKTLLSALSAGVVIFFALQLNPLFLLLLPASLQELVMYAGGKLPVALALIAASLPLVEQAHLPLYLMTSLLSILFISGMRAYMNKFMRAEERQEAMREDLQRANRLLNESNEFMRQSAYTIKLEERNRLSQQIHDEVGHAMAGALIQMEAARRLLATDGGKSAELLGNAIAISKEGLERIRLTLKDWKPRSEELGIHRLRLFADELSAKHGIAVTVTHHGDLEIITPVQWQIIQKNATEAVTNSLKYAEATAIAIEISVLNRYVKAVVADNGRGSAKIIKGLGIIGMEERAAAAGGTVIVDGSSGFSVTTLLPIKT